MRRSLPATLLAAALSTAVTGCSTGGSSEPTAQAKPKAPASQPTAKPSPKRNVGPLALGKVHRWGGKDEKGNRIVGTVTAVAYRQPASEVDLPQEVSDFDKPDWVVLEVKGCVGADSATVSFSQAPWALRFDDDTRLNSPQITGDGTAKPEYPVDAVKVKAGDCLRGKITFSVERGSRPIEAIYGRGEDDPVEWAIPKA